MNKQTRIEFLVSHLVRLEECRVELLDTYFPIASRTRARKEMELWLDRYIGTVETLVATDDGQESEYMPIVLIGCSVTVDYQYPDSPQSEPYTICFPHEVDPVNGCISFLSPIGKQLLLTSPGDKVSVFTPNGETDAVVRRISIPESTLAKYGERREPVKRKG